MAAALCQAWDPPGLTWNDTEVAFTCLDVGGYNYMWREYEPDLAKYPQRVMMGTESYPKEASESWKVVEKNSFVIGDFVWTAMDYIGESGIGHSSIASEDFHDALLPLYPWFNAY